MRHSHASLILASTSAYRRQLLERLQVPFVAIAPGVDESPLATESPSELAHRLAIAKAQAVARHHPHAIVIGSDQVCELNGQALGKPGTLEMAHAQLRLLSGQTAIFRTAVAVIRQQPHHIGSTVVHVEVRFRQLSDATIHRYLEREPAIDCAGSAKSEGLGIALLESVFSNDPTALIGLPLIETSRLLRNAGMDPLS